MGILLGWGLQQERPGGAYVNTTRRDKDPWTGPSNEQAVSATPPRERRRKLHNCFCSPVYASTVSARKAVRCGQVQLGLRASKSLFQACFPPAVA